MKKNIIRFVYIICFAWNLILFSSCSNDTFEFYKAVANNDVETCQIFYKKNHDCAKLRELNTKNDKVTLWLEKNKPQFFPLDDRNKITQRLVNCINCREPVTLAVTCNSLDVLRFLVEQDELVGYLESGLHAAVKYNRTNSANILLEHGANVNDTIYNQDKKQCFLLYAIDKNYVELAKLLLLHGADVNKENDDSQTPLHYVSSLELAKELITHGANLNAHDKDGATPLHFAAKKCNINVVEELLNNGADINAKNKFGQTALIEVSSVIYSSSDKDWKRKCQLDALKVAKILLAHNANKNITDNSGTTALQHALDTNPFIAKELLGLNSYEEWLPTKFNMQKYRNIGKKIVLKSLLLGGINNDNTVYLMDTDVRNFVHNVYYDSYDKDFGVNLEEKLIELSTLRKTAANSADFYGYIGTVVRWGSPEVVFHITHILDSE